MRIQDENETNKSSNITTIIIIYTGNSYVLDRNSFTEIDHNILKTKLSKLIITSKFVESIGCYAFDNCRAQTTINGLPNVESIESYAFAYCEALTTINGLQLVTQKLIFLDKIYIFY